MGIEELLALLTDVLNLDDQAARSESISSAMDVIKSHYAEAVQTSEAYEALQAKYQTLQDENRRLFLLVNEVEESESDSSLNDDVPELDDLFNADGTLKKG